MTKKFNQYKLQEMEQNETKAGTEVRPTCGCACQYANSGGSSTYDNGTANAAHGWTSVIVLPEVVITARTA